MLRLVELSALRIRLRLVESSTSGDWKHSTGSLEDHDHDTLMPRRNPLSALISSALIPLVMLPKNTILLEYYTEFYSELMHSATLISPDILLGQVCPTTKAKLILMA